MNNILNAFIYTLLPLVAGLIIFIGIFKNNPIIIRRFAKYFSVFYLLAGVCCFYFKNTNFELEQIFSSNFTTMLPYMGGYSAGFDTLGGIFAIIISFIVLICFICAKSTVLTKQKIFYSLVLFFESSALTLISTQDFYIFCTAAIFGVLCIYVLLENFLTQKSAKESAKNYFIINAFFIFLLCGSFALVLALLAHNGIEANIVNLTHNCKDISPTIQSMLFIPLLLLGAVKIPFFPLHKPLLDIIKNSNAALSCLFLSEFIIGFYIFIKFNLYTLSTVFEIFAPVLAIMAIFNVLYFSILAIGELDLKKSFGYFYFSQNSIAICAICAMSPEGITGGIFQGISCVLTALGLFLCFCFASQIFKTTKLPFMGALATYTPKLAAMSFILTLSAIGVPLTSGFCAKFLCTIGGFATSIYSQNTIWMCTILIFLGLIVNAIYLINTFQNIFFGADECQKCKKTDLLRHRGFALLCIIFFIILLGVAPYILTGAITKYADMVVSEFLI